MDTGLTRDDGRNEHDPNLRVYAGWGRYVSPTLQQETDTRRGRGGSCGTMDDVDYLVAYVERTQDGNETRRTTTLEHPAGTPAAYHEAYRRWMSGSAAGHRFNLEVRPIDGQHATERV